VSHDPDPQQEVAWARNLAPDARTILGYYGDVYFRAHYFKTTDGKHEGHYHYRDHVSFLWKGSARVEWKAPDGRSGSKDYKAGDFVIVSKDVEHTIIPLEPDTGWICIFAVPQDEGGEPFHSERMDPTHG
jgi:quercetin dioxygenase-like cupin family protein